MYSNDSLYQGYVMEKIYKYFSYIVLALLSVFTVCVFILPDINDLAAQKHFLRSLPEPL